MLCDRLLRRALSALIVAGVGLACDVLQAMDRSLDEGDGS